MDQEIVLYFTIFAMSMAISSVIAPCHFFTHQPNIPIELKKYETYL